MEKSTSPSTKKEKAVHQVEYVHLQEFGYEKSGNVKGDPERMGKAVGTDQIRGKNTYPALIGIDAAEALACRLVNNALKALDNFDKKADPLRVIARYVIERNR